MYIIYIYIYVCMYLPIYVCTTYPATTRHGVTRKTSTKRLKNTGSVFKVSVNSRLNSQNHENHSRESML